MKRPFVLGLTGSIGMGKSTVAAMFAAAGVPVFDADAEVHRLQGPNGDSLGEIEVAFPGTTSVAGVNRAKLGAAVFGKPEALARLEAIVHPAVAAARLRFLDANAGAPCSNGPGAQGSTRSPWFPRRPRCRQRAFWPAPA